MSERVPGRRTATEKAPIVMQGFRRNLDTKQYNSIGTPCSHGVVHNQMDQLYLLSFSS